MQFKKRGISKTISVICMIAVICTSLFFVSSGAEVDYDSKIKELEEKAERIQKENEEREAEIEKYKDDVSQQNYYKKLAEEVVQGIYDQVEANEELVRAKQDSIDRILIEIHNLELSIEQTTSEIDEARAAIDELNEQNNKNLRQFGEIIKGMYMTDNIDPLSLLAGSTDFSDLLIRTEIISKVGEKNLEFMNSLLADIAVLEDLISGLEANEQRLRNDKSISEEKHLRLETEMSALEETKSALEAELATAESKLSKYSSNLAATQNKINSLKQTISASNEEVEEINSQIAELIRNKQRQEDGLPVYSSDGFRWPLDSRFQLITTHFGYDAWRSGNHYGIDVGNAGINGANIYAAQSGVVIRSMSGDASYYGGGYGNYIIIDHGSGISTLYAHCQPWSLRFREGDTVNKGDIIGLVGRTGWATGPHLHFEVRVNGTAVNPFNYNYEKV